MTKYWDIYATFWHQGKVYITCIKSLVWLVTLSNMNKILFTPVPCSDLRSPQGDRRESEMVGTDTFIEL